MLFSTALSTSGIALPLPKHPRIFPSGLVWGRTWVLLVNANPPSSLGHRAHCLFPFCHKPLPLSCRDPRPAPRGEMKKWKIFPRSKRRALSREQGNTCNNQAEKHRMCRFLTYSMEKAAWLFERSIGNAREGQSEEKLPTGYTQNYCFHFFFCLYRYKTTSGILKYNFPAASTEINNGFPQDKYPNP